MSNLPDANETARQTVERFGPERTQRLIDSNSLPPNLILAATEFLTECDRAKNRETERFRIEARGTATDTLAVARASDRKAKWAVILAAATLIIAAATLAVELMH